MKLLIIGAHSQHPAQEPLSVTPAFKSAKVVVKALARSEEGKWSKAFNKKQEPQNKKKTTAPDENPKET